MDNMISVKNVSMKFDLGIEKGNSFKNKFIAIFDKKRRQKKSYFWALDDVSFDVKKGEVLGIIGSIVPILATIYGYMMLYEHFNGYIITPLLTLIKPFNFVLNVSLFVMLLGSVIGMLGSYRAVRKHLKI